mmetsp:Transcript_105626/g.209864  ORF Transcript_105626/g.209864 Transcript_105626/m.209864 type:complete len:141 (+) Transcript_105626:446-868(+)
MASAIQAIFCDINRAAVFGHGVCVSKASQRCIPFLTSCSEKARCSDVCSGCELYRGSCVQNFFLPGFGFGFSVSFGGQAVFRRPRNNLRGNLRGIEQFFAGLRSRFKKAGTMPSAAPLNWSASSGFVDAKYGNQSTQSDR